MISVGLIGLGRTGAEVAKGIIKHPKLSLVMVVCSPKSPKIGHDVGEILGIRSQGVLIQGSTQLETEIRRAQPDVIIDFSSPEACLNNLPVVVQQRKPMIIGTTGFTEEQVQYFSHLASRYRTSIVYAPNLSLGINVLMALIKRAAEVLGDWDIEIIETHHRHKKDAPSGTALKIGQVLSERLGVSSDNITFGHERMGQRPSDRIAIHAVRGGGVVGIHQVLFISENEKLEIKHESLNRMAFVDCLTRVIHYVVTHRADFYTVEDILGLNEPVHCIEKEYAVVAQ